MKKIILFAIISMINTVSFGQWQKIVEIQDDNIYQLIKLNNETTIATGEKTTIYNISGDNPATVTNMFFTYGFLTSSLIIDDNTAYLGGGCYFPFDECVANTLYKTTDGGQSWTPVTTDATFVGTGNILGILPLSENELILVSDFSNLIKVNLNSGVSETFILPGAEDSNQFSFGKISADGKWLIGVSYYNSVTGNTYKYFQSGDNGNSWHELNINLGETEKILLIDFRPDGKLALVSNIGNTYKYADEMLIPIGSISEAYSQITAQFVINESDWYVSTFDPENNRSLLHISIDGGVSWSADFTAEEGIINSLSFNDKNNGYLISNSHDVYKRTGPNNTEEYENTLNLTIAPNPSNDWININTDIDLSTHTIELRDVTGRLVQKHTVPSSQLDVSRLTSGYYHLSIVNSLGSIITSASLIKR